MFLLLLRSGRVFGHGREFSKCSPFGACSHSPSLLSLQMSPPSSSLSPSSAHTMLHDFKLTSVLTPRAAAALLGRSSFSSVLYTVSLSLSVFSWIDKHNCLMVQRYQCSGNGCCHPGCFSPPSWDSLAQSSLTDPFPGTIILRTVLGVSICIIPINQQH